MRQTGFQAAFMRGGTSKGLIIHREDLPGNRSARDALILAAMGSPDPFGRQLDGMGGGVSSLSKIMIVGRSALPDVDIEYTFGQVSPSEAVIRYEGNCGNLTAAVAAFAVNEGLVTARKGIARPRMHNLNTGKTVLATLSVSSGEATVDGDFTVDGVPGSGAPIELRFLDPSGSVSGRLFPTGHPTDLLEVSGVGRVRTTIMDVVDLVAFVSAGALGLSGQERPGEIEADRDTMRKLESVRVEAGLRIEAADRGTGEPHAASQLACVALIRSSRAQLTSESGKTYQSEADLYTQCIMTGVPHRAVPVGGALCAAAAAKTTGTVVSDLLGVEAGSGLIRIAHPAGHCSVDVAMSASRGGHIGSLTVYRTARLLMRGTVYAPQSRLLPAV